MTGYNIPSMFFGLKFRQASFEMFYTMFQHQIRTKCRVRFFNIELAENKQIKANITDVEFLARQLEDVRCEVPTPETHKTDVVSNVPTSC